MRLRDRLHNLWYRLAFPDREFDYDLNDGRIAHCIQVSSQGYLDCEFSAGLVEGIPPEAIYVRLQRHGAEPSYWFMRRDEIEAMIHVMSGALWSLALADDEETAGLRKAG